MTMQVFTIPLVIDQVVGCSKMRMNGETIHLQLLIVRIFNWNLLAGNTIFLISPATEINKLTPFRTERTMLIVVPGNAVPATGTTDLKYFHLIRHRLSLPLTLRLPVTAKGLGINKLSHLASPLQAIFIRSSIKSSSK
jgi:hypothetical protein